MSDHEWHDANEVPPAEGRYPALIDDSFGNLHLLTAVWRNGRWTTFGVQYWTFYPPLPDAVKNRTIYKE